MADGKRTAKWRRRWRQGDEKPLGIEGIGLLHCALLFHIHTYIYVYTRTIPSILSMSAVERQ